MRKSVTIDWTLRESARAKIKVLVKHIEIRSQPALAHCFPLSFTFYVAHPDRSILSDQFLAEVRGLKYKNVAAELLPKLLGDEIKTRSKRHLVQSREFSAGTRVKERPGFQMLKMPSSAEGTTNEFLACRGTCSSIAHQ